MKITFDAANPHTSRIGPEEKDKIKLSQAEKDKDEPLIVTTDEFIADCFDSTLFLLIKGLDRQVTIPPKTSPLESSRILV